MRKSQVHKEYGEKPAGTEKEGSGPGKRVKRKVLIVEDEWITARFMKKLLESAHFSVIGIAATGRDAVKIVKENNPDFIIMDIVLQGDMDGIDTMKEILSIARIPFIYSTANADNIDKNRIISTTPREILNKPIDKNRLISIIDNALA
jgi:CheY-like chemotaxis protein